MNLRSISFRSISFASILLCVSTAVGQEKSPLPPDGPVKPAPGPNSAKAYLGLSIGDLHPALASHLPNLQSEGQGVTVESVSPNSPGAKAGIREHDILLTYDDQKLFSREQLVKLISHDRPGREVSIRLIRQGKEEVAKITLGERPLNWAPPPHWMERRSPVPPIFERPPHVRNVPDATVRMNRPRPTWHHLDSITIKWLEKDRFRATLTHFDNEGKLEKHEYEGTREELRKLIDADDDLKPNERHHLFRSLDIEDHPNPWELLRDDTDSGF